MNEPFVARFISLRFLIRYFPIKLNPFQLEIGSDVRID